MMNWSRGRELLRTILPVRVRRAVSRMRRVGGIDEVALIHQLVAFGYAERFMVDVGARYGESLEDFAIDGWKVLAFEPDPSNRAILVRRVAGNMDVTIDPRAVSDTTEQSRPFYISDISTGISSLSAFHSSHREAGRVEVTTLREALGAEAFGRVGFLKIDTEGHDLKVLRGFPWERLSPSVIVCEFEDRKTIPLGYSFRDMGSYLVDKGYSVLVSEWYPVVEYGQRHRWRRFVQFPCELDHKDAWGNFIAVRDLEKFGELTENLGLDWNSDRYRATARRRR